MPDTEPDASTPHHAVLILLQALALLALVAGLLTIRRREPGAFSPRADRGVAVACVVLAVLLAATWPSTTVRGWLGWSTAEACVEKDVPLPTAGRPTSVGIETLKADVRLGRLDGGPPNELESTGSVQLDVVTGPDSSGRTADRWGVAGTDLGHPFVLDGRLGLLFGDTFEVPSPSGPGWRSNTLGWVDGWTGSAAGGRTAEGQTGEGQAGEERLEVTAMTESRAGRAGELLGSLKVEGLEKTVIPTNATVVGDTIVMHYMTVACWGRPGDWAVSGSGLATSRDGGRTFQRVDGARFPSGSPFAQVAFVPPRDDPGDDTPDGSDHVHVFGIPEGRGGAVHLARVPADELLDTSAWRYWDGRDWVADVADVAEVAPAPAGELSVGWNAQHQRWLMLYLDELRGGVVMRTSPDLTGPWSRASLVVSSLEVPTLYAPYLLPGTGDDIGISYTLSRFDIYNVVLMRSRLQAVPAG